MVIPYYCQFLLRRVSIIVNPTSVVVPKPCQGPYPSYAIAITSRDNQNHRTMERRDYDVTKETHKWLVPLCLPTRQYSGSDYSDTSNSLNMQAREIPVPFTIIHAWIILLPYTVV